MGAIRLIIFALVIWLAWRMLKNYQLKRKQASNAKRKILEKEKVVMCQLCSIHLPESEAFSHQENWFCSQKHKQKFLTDNDT